VLSVSDLEGDLVERVIRSCRVREPTVEAVLVHGSYATGRARSDSDLDLDLFIAGEPSARYKTWFEPRQDHQLLHVSARCDLNIDVWEEEAEEPEDWALGLPVELPHSWLWRGDGRLVDVLGERPVLTKPGSAPEVEDMIDAVIKMRRHAAAGDELGGRLEAQAAARYAAPTVAALNTPRPVTDPRSALDTILALPVAPPDWASNLVVAMGLVAHTIDEVVEATHNLALGVLRLAREVNPHVDPQPEIARYLTDGTLERMLQ
jgi:predicted nucleotidyltransferase